MYAKKIKRRCTQNRIQRLTFAAHKTQYSSMTNLHEQATALADEALRQLGETLPEVQYQKFVELCKRSIRDNDPANHLQSAKIYLRFLLEHPGMK